MSGQTIRLVGPKQRKLAYQLIDIAPDGAVVNIKEASRSLDQNALVWQILSDIARAKPDGRVMKTEEWKILMMDACGHKPKFIPGLDGGFVCAGYRSSRLTKAEFSELIECAMEYAARHGVDISIGQDDNYPLTK